MLVTLKGYGLKDDISNKDFNLYVYTRTAKFTSSVEKNKRLCLQKYLCDKDVHPMTDLAGMLNNTS